MKNSSRVNRQYYDSEQPGRYDYWQYMAAPRLRRTRIVEQIAHYQPRLVADLGCGDGLLLQHLSGLSDGRKFAGVDLSPVQISRNREKLPHIEWFCADIGADELPTGLSGRFDMVISSEVIEHVDDDRAFLVAARRLARPAGLLVLTTQSGAIRPTEMSVGHVRHYTADSLRTVLEESGWLAERVWNEGFPFHDLSKWAANLKPEAAMRRFGERRFGALERFTSFALRALFTFNSRSRGAQLFAIAKNPAADA